MTDFIVLSRELRDADSLTLPDVPPVHYLRQLPCPECGQEWQYWQQNRADLTLEFYCQMCQITWKYERR